MDMYDFEMNMNLPDGDEDEKVKVQPREFNHSTTWCDVENMTAEEAIRVLSRHTCTNSKEFSPRPHMAKACQMAVSCLQRSMIQGNWKIECRGKVCVCSYCKTEFDNTCNCIEEWDYCPKCGTKMGYSDKTN